MVGPDSQTTNPDLPVLRELHISNLAVIEDAAIELVPGLNVFTGQTGAGKSLVIGAFEILLGLRSAGDMLRPGSDEGRVSGVFEVHDSKVTAEVAATLDQPVQPGEQLLITRKIFASGRTSVSVNGQPATAAMVRQVGQLLVDIHGQHDHQYLLKPSNQLLILDAFGRCEELADEFAVKLAQLREWQQQKKELAASQTLRRQQLELYEFQADEIDQVQPQLGEFPELQARFTALSNLGRLKKDASQAHAALYEADGSISERLQMLTHLLIDLTEVDDTLSPITEQVREATLSLQESAFELNRYLDRLELNPSELAEVEDRLNTLNRLVQKYSNHEPNDDPLEPVIAYRQQIGEQIDQLRGQNQGLADIDQRISALQGDLQKIGRSLTDKRQQATAALRPLVEAQLKELGMAEARFDVAIDTTTLDDPTLGSRGLDQIEIVVQTNPGQTMQPLRKIASGGELSRIMLAIKSILAGNDRISVLVFDEIDANIGGRLGSVIGDKLRNLAAGRSPADAGRKKSRKGNPDHGDCHQVLCITHLPQIAAFGDQHLHIAKRVVGKGKSKQTVTTVQPLDGDARVEELAEMMAGKQATDTTRKQVREMLAAAQG